MGKEGRGTLAVRWVHDVDTALISVVFARGIEVLVHVSVTGLRRLQSRARIAAAAGVVRVEGELFV